MTRAEFEAAKAAVTCPACGASYELIDKDIPPPHYAKLTCSGCGSFGRWIAKEPEMPPGYQGRDLDAPPNWIRSKKGNLFRKFHGKIVTVFHSRGGFKWVHEGQFSELAWDSESEACEAADEEFL